MHLRVKRDTFTSESTIGMLYVNERPFCFSLEDMVREQPGVDVLQWKIPGMTAIPRGTYAVILRMSPKRRIVVPELTGVPGFSNVQIHSGNTSYDTEGCIVVGKRRGVNIIYSSRAAFGELMVLLITEADKDPRGISITVE